MYVEGVALTLFHFSELLYNTKSFKFPFYPHFHSEIEKSCTKFSV